MSTITPIVARVEQYLIGLVGAMEDEFREHNMGDPCILTVMPGEVVALDYCHNEDCGAGMAWVRLIQIRPSDEVLQQPGMSCYQALSAEVEIGIIRAAPAWDNGPPSAQTQLAAAMSQMKDADLMLHVLNHVENEDGETAYAPTYTPMGPEGGCLGGTWTAQLRVT